MIRTAILGASLAVALAGCDRRPQAIVVCHNANCAHAPDPARDVTLAALDDSLALTYLDRPAIDGMELDTVWDRASGRCLFTHDLAHASDATGIDAADRVAAYLGSPIEEVSWRGDWYFVKLEFKDVVDLAGTPHDADDRARHYACLFDMYDRISAAAEARGRELEFAIESTADLARGIVEEPRWPGKEPRPGLHLRLIANVSSGGLQPEDLASLRGDRTAGGIDVLSFHASRLTDGEAQAYRSLRAALMLWMLDSAIETFYAVEAYQPDYVVTNEALVMRRWMEQ